MILKILYATGKDGVQGENLITQLKKGTFSGATFLKRPSAPRLLRRDPYLECGMNHIYFIGRKG